MYCVTIHLQLNHQNQEHPFPYDDFNPGLFGYYDGFYDQVRADPLLGPVFNQRISDWGPHLEQMRLFWSSVALMSGAYHGRPMPKHLPLPVDARHFDRWLELFEATAAEVCPPVAAAHFVERARRIAESLELGVANANGVLVGPGERYTRQQPAWEPD